MVAVERVLLQPVLDVPHLDLDATQSCVLPWPLLFSVFLQLGKAVHRVGLLGEIVSHDLLFPVEPSLAVRKVNNKFRSNVAVEILLLKKLHLTQILV